MPIRPATYSDIVPGAKILARAFKDEYLFGHFMYPKLDEYPDGLYLHFLHVLRMAYVSGPDCSLLISYRIDPETQQETLTGVAQWQRMRAKPKTSYYTAAATKAMQAYNYLESSVYPNRAADPSRVHALEQCGLFIAHHWTGSRAEVWDLTIVGIDPTFHGQGVGQELVKWGFDRAKEEGVGCSVICAENKESFYEKRGFDVTVGTCRDEGGEANPLRDVTGGTIMFWDNGRDVSGVKKYGQS